MKTISTLGLFYANENEREAVKEFLINTLKDIAVEKTFNKEDVSGIAEARQLVDKAFDRLSELYGKIDKVIVETTR
jgi:hypothetical protein